MKIKSFAIKEDTISVSYRPSDLSDSIVNLKLTKTYGFEYQEIIDFLIKELSIKSLKKYFDIFLKSFSVSEYKISDGVFDEEAKLVIEFVSKNKDNSFTISTPKIRNSELLELIHKFEKQIKDFIKTYNKQLSLFPEGNNDNFTLTLQKITADA